MKLPRLTLALLPLLSLTATPMQAKDSNRTVNLKILETTDVHGNFFPYNFITRSPWSGSMARVAQFVDSARSAAGEENVILLDNGDILQGQPTVYYYNFIDTVTPHIASRIYDFMGYDAATIGNHDVETGHAVYDRWIRQTGIPVLGANVIDNATDRPYLKPYTIIERDGVKIAVIGLLTPAIPAWLPEPIWSGLHFDDMESTARKWVEIVKEIEKPHLIIGLFHSGADASRHTGEWVENASVEVARKVPGFDAVFLGHDHQRLDGKVVCGNDTVITLNPAANANAIAELDVTLTLAPDGTVVSKSLNGTIHDISEIAPSERYLTFFANDREKVDQFVERVIGASEGEFSSRDAYFGPSAFIDLIHRLQLDITGADISFAAPLSADAVIAAGPMRVSDMFNLYKYENLLYTMELTGAEIRNYLEEAYRVRLADNPVEQGHLLRFESANPSLESNRLAYPAYNFDSAAGINYTVDITRPIGERVNITSMADGTPFDPEKTYTIAVNSYRGNGGGDLMTKGAALSREDIKTRIKNSTELDLRYYMMKQIEQEGSIRPVVTRNWEIIPAEIVAPLIEKDRELLFSPASSRDQK